MVNSQTANRKITTVIEGDLRVAAEEVASRTHMGISDLLRAGLAKVVLEYRATGAVTMQAVPAELKPQAA